MRFHDDAGDEEKERSDDRFVMVSEILNDMSVEGYLGMSGTHVRAVDGTKVRNLRHLVDLVESCTNEFVRIAVDCGEERDFEIVLDVAQTREATPRVMKRFQIPDDRSPDLREEEGSVGADEDGKPVVTPRNATAAAQEAPSWLKQ